MKQLQEPYRFPYGYRYRLDNITTSPFKSTLTELHLAFGVNGEDFFYIGQLHNLRVLSLHTFFDITDEDIIHLKVNIDFA